MLRSKVLMFALAAVALSLCVPTVGAQSAVMPIPAVKVLDGDGKIVGEVVDLYCKNTEECYPVIVINVEGKPAFLHMRAYGLINLTASASDGHPALYFSAPGCTGDAAIGQFSGISNIIGVKFAVAGPDATLGTYKLYRTTSLTTTTFNYQSFWRGGVCLDEGPANVSLYPAEEVIPNPLEGFHGPTVAQPDRTWSLQGGTTYVPPAP